MIGHIEDLGKASVTVEDYVPNKPYFENTIVTDPDLGISAISRIPVPAGIPLTDNRFWMRLSNLDTAVMFNYKRMVQEFRQMKEAFQSMVNGCNGVPITNCYGDNTDRAVSQKVLTATLRSIFKLLEEVSTTYIPGLFVTMESTVPEGSEEAVIEINGDARYYPFDYYGIYFNNVLMIDGGECDKFNYISPISDGTVVKIVVTCLGIDYTQEKVINLN